MVNVGCREKDLAHIESHMIIFKAHGGDCNWHIHDKRSLLALQCTLSASMLQNLTKEDLRKFFFSDFLMININRTSCYLTRMGYTRKSGFGILVPLEHAINLAKAILEKLEENVKFTGLGACDSLKIEAGIFLYGNDMQSGHNVM